MNRRLFKPLTEWTLTDVQGLVDEAIPEGQRLEYKEDLPLDRDRDRAELAKDVSGLANAVGGLLIYGVAEDESDEPRPVAVRALPRAGQQTRLENVVDSTVQPRIDYECRTLDAGDGTVLVVRVAPRSGGPCMVQGYKQNRYFIRRGTRTVPMSESEVRAAYEVARKQSDELFEMLALLPLVTRISRARSLDQLRLRAAGIPEPDEWLPLVSVVTAPLDTTREVIKPAHVAPESFPESFNDYVGRNRQLRQAGRYSVDAWGLNDEALAETDGLQAPQIVVNRVRIYRQGVCEWAHRYAFSVPDPHAIPSSSFAEDVHNSLLYFGAVYDTVEYAGRLAVFVRLDNAEKAWLSVHPHLSDRLSSTPTLMEDINVYCETTVDALLGDPLPLVRDAMQRIWQCFGYRNCLLFDADGEWVSTG